MAISTQTPRGWPQASRPLRDGPQASKAPRLTSRRHKHTWGSSRPQARAGPGKAEQTRGFTCRQLPVQPHQQLYNNYAIFTHTVQTLFTSLFYIYTVVLHIRVCYVLLTDSSGISDIPFAHTYVSSNVHEAFFFNTVNTANQHFTCCL